MPFLWKSNQTLCYLGLGAGAVRGEAILPLRKTQVGDHQSVVRREGCCQKMPAQWAVEEPNFTLLGYNTWKIQRPTSEWRKMHFTIDRWYSQYSVILAVFSLTLLFGEMCNVWIQTEHLQCSFCRLGTLCHSHHRNPTRKCGSGNQNGVQRERAPSLPDRINESWINIYFPINVSFISLLSAQLSTQTDLIKLDML